MAINPVDWKIQTDGDFFPEDKYPFILGEDCAGVVEEVGEGVKGLGRGDRVVAYVLSHLVITSVGSGRRANS